MSALSKSFAKKMGKTYREEFSLKEILAKGITKEELIAVMVNSNGNRTRSNNSAYCIDMTSINGGFLSYSMFVAGINELTELKNLRWKEIDSISVYRR